MAIKGVSGSGSDFGPMPEEGGESSGHAQRGARHHSDGSDVSALASVMSSLQQLQREDPVRFRRVVDTVAAVLRSESAVALGARAGIMRQLADGFEEAGRVGNLLPELPPHSGSHGRERAARGVQSYGVQQASETGDPMLGLSFDLARMIQTAMAMLRVQR